MPTTDAERELVIRQNAALGATFAHLRRCFVCLGTACGGGCREERGAWAKKTWNGHIVAAIQRSGGTPPDMEWRCLDSGP